MISKEVKIANMVQNGDLTTTKIQWAVGDAILAAYGPPGSKSVSLKELTAVFKKRGLEYSQSSLERLRGVAHRFPPETRVRRLTWSTHREVGSPQMMKTMLEICDIEKVKKVKRGWVRAFMKRYKDALAREKQHHLEVAMHQNAFDGKPWHVFAKDASAAAQKTAKELILSEVVVENTPEVISMVEAHTFRLKPKEALTLISEMTKMHEEKELPNWIITDAAKELQNLINKTTALHARLTKQEIKSHLQLAFSA